MRAIGMSSTLAYRDERAAIRLTEADDEKRCLSMQALASSIGQSIAIRSARYLFVFVAMPILLIASRFRDFRDSGLTGPPSGARKTASISDCMPLAAEWRQQQPR